MKKSVLATIILILLTLSAWAQNYDVNYYGVFSDDLDENMTVMTSDLYYTQLSEIQNINVSDFRSPDFDIEDSSAFSKTAYSFYSIVKKKENSSKWSATFNLVSKAGANLSVTKEYDSYYKILMDTKGSLQDTILSLLENRTTSLSDSDSPIPQAAKTVVSTEELAGTWGGEENVNKIVIMRGGRGFVIFKNGASMNINVAIDGQDVTISQNGRTNASFFPDLPRQVAMTLALSAEPITWHLTMNGQDTLSGKKKTLIPTTDGAESGFVEVSWHKIN